jgi:predicted DNA-binding WGR domain protein
MEQRIKNLIKKHGLSGVNSPKKTPSHPTKKGIVLAKEGDRVKLIRFGDQNMGHNYSPEARKSFKSRHAKNIAKGKMSAAYWADKAFWGGPSADKKMPPKSQEYTRGLKKYAEGGKVKDSLKKYEPSDAVKKTKAALAVASNLPLVGKYAAIGSAVGDAYTAARYYADGNKPKAKEDLIQAGLSLARPFRGKVGLKGDTQLSNFAKNANKALKVSQVSSDAKTVYESKNKKKYAEGGKVATKSNPSLWEKAKAQAKARMGGKHSARAMQLAVSIYKKSGGDYKGPKKETSLSKWTKQDWTTSSGKPSEGKRRYLPKAAWSALSSAQKAATNKAKAKGDSEGKQFVSQPKSIAEKVAKYRS